ncbi:TRC40/GET3/ArsA family transport-energizing ATPase [Corallococcus sp. NCSPR001]|nr:TRC40/GET3/ArsA family transport-energizing ATPase [Corallococcus sp. NCSPR001]
MQLTASGTPYLFFTGKGGVGKTSLACATAIRLADAGRRVLLVSTDPDSNLDEMLGVELSRQPRAVPGVPGLMALDIDPEAAADAYRERVLAPFLGHAPETEVKKIREELSGACTTEIAAFDEFAGLLEATWRQQFDHVVFDTAPTGHTLRLLSLPRAWTDFLDSNTRGASCLGPHSGLTMRRERFSAALAALADPQLTTVVLVTRPERAALQEAERTAGELRALGLVHQRLVINGVFRPMAPSDPVALAIREREQAALARMPPALRSLPAEQVARVVRDHARRVALVPWMAQEPTGLERLHALATHPARGERDSNAPDSILPARPASPALVLQERHDAGSHVIANLAHALHRLALGVFQRPVLPLQPRHVRAGVAAPHGDEPLSALRQFVREALGPGARQVDAHLGHGGLHLGMNALTGLGPGGNGTRPGRIHQGVEEGRRHLRAAGIVDTGEDDRVHREDSDGGGEVFSKRRGSTASRASGKSRRLSHSDR